MVRLSTKPQCVARDLGPVRRRCGRRAGPCRCGRCGRGRGSGRVRRAEPGMGACGSRLDALGVHPAFGSGAGCARMPGLDRPAAGARGQGSAWAWVQGVDHAGWRATVPGASTTPVDVAVHGTAVDAPLFSALDCAICMALTRRHPRLCAALRPFLLPWRLLPWALAPSLADARAGGGSSAGQPWQPDVLRAALHQHRAVGGADAAHDRRRSPHPRRAQPMGQPTQPARSGFGSGLMGGIAGGLAGRRPGQHVVRRRAGRVVRQRRRHAGLPGAAAAGARCLFFLVRWAVRAFMRRQQPAMAGGPRPRTGHASAGAADGHAGRRDGRHRAVHCSKADYDAFERNLAGRAGCLDRRVT